MIGAESKVFIFCSELPTPNSELFIQDPLEGPAPSIEKMPKGIGPQCLCSRLPHLFIPLSIRPEEPKAIRPRNRQSKALPLLYRTIETEKVFFLLVSGQHLFLIGTIKIDEKELFSGYQNIFKLEIPMKETSFMKLMNEQTGRTDGSSFMEKDITGRVRPNL